MYGRHPDGWEPVARPWWVGAVAIAALLGFIYNEADTRWSAHELRPAAIDLCVDAGVGLSDCDDRFDANAAPCYRANYHHGGRYERGGLITAGFFECVRYPSIDEWWKR